MVGVDPATNWCVSSMSTKAYRWLPSPARSATRRAGSATGYRPRVSAAGRQARRIDEGAEADLVAEIVKLYVEEDMSLVAIAERQGHSSW